MSRLLVTALLSSAMVALLGWTDCGGQEASAEAVDPALVGPDTVRVKGLQPHLVIHRKRGDSIDTLAPQDVAHPGDTLQVCYVAAGHRHGVVVSIDGAGTVTLHHPATVLESSRLNDRGENPLPNAFELDDAPAFERFFLVTTGDTPTDINLVMNSATTLASNPEAARTADLDLPSGFSQSTVLLRKNP